MYPPEISAKEPYVSASIHVEKPIHVFTYTYVCICEVAQQRTDGSYVRKKYRGFFFADTYPYSPIYIGGFLGFFFCGQVPL